VQIFFDFEEKPRNHCDKELKLNQAIEGNINKYRFLCNFMKENTRNSISGLLILALQCMRQQCGGITKRRKNPEFVIQKGNYFITCD